MIFLHHVGGTYMVSCVAKTPCACQAHSEERCRNLHYDPVDGMIELKVLLLRG
jgi:hypothetical protein